LKPREVLSLLSEYRVFSGVFFVTDPAEIGCSLAWNAAGEA
jgi:hypothetical protein